MSRQAKGVRHERHDSKAPEPTCCWLNLDKPAADYICSINRVLDKELQVGHAMSRQVASSNCNLSQVPDNLVLQNQHTPPQKTHQLLCMYVLRALDIIA